ncbi:MAG TPA: hypothetical protein VJU77_19015 [Chthoniobacterales bacterium]|nr:hypothetical protein [Chthoniobacterales bacterium]
MDRKVFDLSHYRGRDESPISTRRSSTALGARRQGEFLKGPIPLSWLSVAACLPGKALHVGVAIWFEHGRRKHAQFKLTAAIVKRFGVARKAGYRALGTLERAGLIKTDRRHGKNPIITLTTEPKPLDRGGSRPSNDVQTRERPEQP